MPTRLDYKGWVGGGGSGGGSFPLFIVSLSLKMSPQLPHFPHRTHSEVKKAREPRCTKRSQGEGGSVTTEEKKVESKALSRRGPLGKGEVRGSAAGGRQLQRNPLGTTDAHDTLRRDRRSCALIFCLAIRAGREKMKRADGGHHARSTVTAVRQYKDYISFRPSFSRENSYKRYKLRKSYPHWKGAIARFFFFCSRKVSEKARR
jgi:hypothetical protein